MIFYFSGCGNSRFIAQSLANDEELVFIPDAMREKRYRYALQNGENVGFVFPIYSWCPPQLVIDFIDRIKFDNAPSYVWMAVTCGGNAGMAEKVFRQHLADIGLPLHGAFCFVMPNTYVNMAGMSIDKESVAQRKIAKAKETLPTVAQHIAERKSISTMRKGLFPYFKTYVIGKSFGKWVSDKPFHYTDKCIACGKCVSVCPLKNISLENGHPRWNGNCTNCEACYHHCPQNAIQFGKATAGKGQYYFKQNT